MADPKYSPEEIQKARAKLDAELEKGLADIRAGRVHTSEEVWEAVYKHMREVQARKAKQGA
ncbi:MAG TPA: hypothetical protein VGF56_15315 [Rhizomicrobium sp.]|jgi:predicted transcriptional regulator